MSTYTTADFKRLLSEFEELPKSQLEMSIFDISGYPHYENVASNVLAFYLNPHNEHGLQDLLLSSILNKVAIEDRNLKNVLVSREESTFNQKRLDLLIETDNLLIGIENKIFHHLNNDLNDYSYALKKWAQPNNLEIVKIVLSIKKEQPSDGFVNVTYEELFTEIRRRMSHYQITKNKWYFYLLDFMNSIEGLAGSKMKIDENDQFFLDNFEKIEALLGERNKFLAKLNNKVVELQQKIEKPPQCKRQWIYSKSCLVHDFEFFSYKIAFDLFIAPSGWQLQLFGRDAESKKYLTFLFNTIPLKGTQQGYKDSRYILEEFCLHQDLSTIAASLLKRFSMLLESQERAEMKT